MLVQLLQAAENSALCRANQSRKKREKMFGEGRLLPLDRNAKARIMVFARAKMRRTEKGKHYGELTGKHVEVLRALLWGFHNALTGRCFPSYEAIAKAADCARSTVYEAIHALEVSGILTWVNRIKRVKELSTTVDMFGHPTNRVRVLRTSNAYTFNDSPSKSELQTGTQNQPIKKEKKGSAELCTGPLAAALANLGRAVVGRQECMRAESVR